MNQNQENSGKRMTSAWSQGDLGVNKGKLVDED